MVKSLALIHEIVLDLPSEHCLLFVSQTETRARGRSHRVFIALGGRERGYSFLCSGVMQFISSSGRC